MDKTWEITKLDVYGSAYHIEGINHCARLEMDRRFYWTVDSISNPRYFAAKNIKITEAAARRLEMRAERIGGEDE